VSRRAPAILKVCFGSIWDAPSRVGTVPTLHLTQIPPADLDVAVLGQLATA
jgi:hypothetical protein